jgi:hypothetical protein
VSSPVMQGLPSGELPRAAATGCGAQQPLVACGPDVGGAKDEWGDFVEAGGEGT